MFHDVCDGYIIKNIDGISPEIHGQDRPSIPAALLEELTEKEEGAVMSVHTEAVLVGAISRQVAVCDHDEAVFAEGENGEPFLCRVCF